MLRFVLVLALALGVVLRCEGLGRKVAWYDEVGTMLRLSGHTEAEVARAADGLSPPELRARFQSARTGTLTSGVAAVVHAVTEDESLHSPGYFVTAYAWTRAAGDGTARLRLLSALASLAALPLLGALAWRLFRDRTVALVSVALAALSPLQIRYAQEARSYALWSVTLLAAMLAASIAGERRTRSAWSAVALAFAAALYVHPLSLLVIPALLLLAADAAAERDDVPHATRVAAGAVCVAIVAWLPWMLVVLENRQQSARTAAWMGDAAPFVGVVRAWFGVATSILFRPGGPGGLLDGVTLPGTGVLWLLLGVLASALIVAAVVHTAWRAPRSARRFVPALALLPFATLAVADILLGGRRSTVDRYLLPAWLAVELAVAFLLAPAGARARLRHGVLLVVLALGAATALRSRPLDTWWNTEPEQLARLGVLANALSAAAAPIVVTDAPPLRVLELAHRLQDAVTLRLGVDAPESIADDDWPRVWLVAPTEELLTHARAAATHAGVTLERTDDGLAWRAVRDRR